MRMRAVYYEQQDEEAEYGEEAQQVGTENHREEALKWLGHLLDLA